MKGAWGRQGEDAMGWVVVVRGQGGGMPWKGEGWNKRSSASLGPELLCNPTEGLAQKVAPLLC